MSSLQEIHTAAVFNVSPQDIPNVGIPTFYDPSVGCNQSHRPESSCRGCRWNYCQGCGAAIWLLNMLHLFGGWTKFCQDCLDHSKCELPKVPDAWKEIYTEQPVAEPPPPEPPAVKEEVIEIDSDKEEEKPAQKTDYPETWEISDGEDIRDIKTVAIIDDGIASPKHMKEILAVIDMLDKARARCDEILEDIPQSFASNKQPPYFMITNLLRVQNYRLLRMYKTAVEEATHLNKKRDSPADTMEGIAFHGTDLRSALLIAELGMKTSKTKNGQYGWGFYTGLGNLAVPMVYAKRKAQEQGGVQALVLGDCLVGRNSQTHYGQDQANPGDDTGGCGNAWVHTLFDNYHELPTYIASVKDSTKYEWEAQKASFKLDAVMGALRLKLIPRPVQVIQPLAIYPPAPAAAIPPAAVAIQAPPAAAIPPAPAAIQAPPPAAIPPAPAAIPPISPRAAAAAAIVAIQAPAIPPAGAAAGKKRATPRKKVRRFTHKKRVKTSCSTAAPCTSPTTAAPSSSSDDDESESDGGGSDPSYMGGK